MSKLPTKEKRLAFVWDFSVNPIEMYSWEDGLNAALKYLANDHQYYIKVICHDKPEAIYQELKDFAPDLILAWGSLDRPSFAGLNQFKVPAYLCFAGGPTQHPHTTIFDAIFVENDEYLEAFKAQGVNVFKAFGTNDQLFRPLPLQKKFEACYPASFAAWKRHDLFAQSVGRGGVACGKINHEEYHCFKVCIDNGVTVLPDVPYKAVPYIYNQSKFALITAATTGGSQRAVLEAMACNVVPIVMADSIKCREYVMESGFGHIIEPTVDAIKEALATLPWDMQGGREFIEAKYSAKGYAEAMHKVFSA